MNRVTFWKPEIRDRLGRPKINITNTVDKNSKQHLPPVAAPSINATDVIATTDHLLAGRESSPIIYVENHPRFNREILGESAHTIGSTIYSIEPNSRCMKYQLELFGGKLNDGLPNIQLFKRKIDNAPTLHGQWPEQFNSQQPHSRPEVLSAKALLSTPLKVKCQKLGGTIEGASLQWKPSIAVRFNIANLTRTSPIIAQTRPVHRIFA